MSVGLNKPQTNGFTQHYAYRPGFTLHSEFEAVNKIRRKVNLRGSVCYNLRLGKDGNISISKPCPSCARMLKAYGIKKVTYTTGNGVEVFKFSGYKEARA